MMPQPAKKDSGEPAGSQHHLLDGVGCHRQSGQRMPLQSSSPRRRTVSSRIGKGACGSRFNRNITLA
jgi:hypothetical protein